MPLDVHRPFTRADAIAAGISPSMLRGSRFRRTLRGVYVHADSASSPYVRVLSALAIHPEGAVAMSTSAACVYRLPIRLPALEHIGVFRRGDRRPRDEVRSHLLPAGTPVVTVNGIRVVAAQEMFCQLAAVLDLVDLVVVGDALIRLGHTTQSTLVAGCADRSGPSGALARMAASLVRAEVESAMESRLRMLIVLSGLPEPVINHKVFEHGRLIYRLDLSYPELKLIIEYDGRQHIDDPRQWNGDIARREWLDRHGWMLVTVVARGIYTEPDVTVERIRSALELRGVRVTTSDRWLPHFPSRR